MKKRTLIFSLMPMIMAFLLSPNLFGQKSTRMTLLEQFTNAS